MIKMIKLYIRLCNFVFSAAFFILIFLFSFSQEFLNEQIQILQGKISCLEDELSRASKEEIGENMGPIIEVKSIILF